MEILFRAKRTDNGEWAEGLLSYDMDGCLEEMLVYRGFCNCDTYEVDPETICCYTGLDGGNGRRFEGDIFQAGDGDCTQRYLIAWDKDSLRWSAECIGDPDGTLPLSEFKTEGIEVIGNIFDNPELLDG